MGGQSIRGKKFLAESFLPLCMFAEKPDDDILNWRHLVA